MSPGIIANHDGYRPPDPQDDPDLAGMQEEALREALGKKLFEALGRMADEGLRELPALPKVQK